MPILIKTEIKAISLFLYFTEYIVIWPFVGLIFKERIKMLHCYEAMLQSANLREEINRTQVKVIGLVAFSPLKAVTVI